MCNIQNERTYLLKRCFALYVVSNYLFTMQCLKTVVPFYSSQTVLKNGPMIGQHRQLIFSASVTVYGNVGWGLLMETAVAKRYELLQRHVTI